MTERFPELAKLAPLTYGSPQAILVSEETWWKARAEVCEACREQYGAPVPFVNREFTDGAIPHFLFRLIPVVPV